ncbi:hypothetical protein [Yoonia sp. BS5-3]|uniref:DUF4177 domain-containing protein n=1 Tax=Yoonia phaeophyticola TaxID=3137369 RepID=A0ABZ2VB42_9RHOB
MKNLCSAFLLIWLSAGMAHAACYADYKAKQDNPLRLHYGVVRLPGECSVRAAENLLRSALSRDGWQLLNVVGVFEDDGLAQRRDSAGEYFLRY